MHNYEENQSNSFYAMMPLLCANNMHCAYIVLLHAWRDIILLTVCFASNSSQFKISLFLCSAGIYWGDEHYTLTNATKVEPFTESHTFKEAGCTDVLIMYGNYYPYCGEYYREIVHIQP